MVVGRDFCSFYPKTSEDVIHRRWRRFGCAWQMLLAISSQFFATLPFKKEWKSISQRSLKKNDLAQIMRSCCLSKQQLGLSPWMITFIPMLEHLYSKKEPLIAFKCPQSKVNVLIISRMNYLSFLPCKC